MDRRPLNLLVVEDSEGDIHMLRHCLRDEAARLALYRVANGDDCLAFLRKQPPYAEAPSPDILILDLSLPGTDGREVMTELLADERLRHLPVVILTTSANEHDIREMYRLRCNSYLIKPFSLDEFCRKIRIFSDYWFNMGVLPPRLL